MQKSQQQLEEYYKALKSWSVKQALEITDNFSKDELDNIFVSLT